LEGITTETQILLSCFDGSHAFLFIAEMNSLGEIIGRFYSGSHWEENWKGKKNTNFSLRKADEITQIEEPNSQLNFKFINIHGQTVTLEDEKFRNKMVILQLMGSWCPNCMDETKYFSELYEKFKPNGLEIVGICFERTEDTLKARKNILRLKERFNVNYELLVTGLSGKEKASETFPMLSKVSAFPTTLYLNRDKKIVRVHSGFSGPATGEEYEKFKSETEKLILDLLK
jgi:thiol-disulfide isomerase/thioredoxin